MVGLDIFLSLKKLNLNKILIDYEWKTNHNPAANLLRTTDLVGFINPIKRGEILRQRTIYRVRFCFQRWDWD